MRGRRGLSSGFVGLLCFVGVLGLISGRAAASQNPADWGSAVEVPGTAALNAGGDAQTTSISCAAPGDCAAVGYYVDGSHHGQAFVVDETNGVWGNAIEVPGMAALNTGGALQVRSVSCGAVGECAAGGYYEDGSGHGQAFVVDETNGVWGNAIEVPGTAALNDGGGHGAAAGVVEVSCAGAGDCAAGGYYSDGSGHYQAFVVNETNGVWGNAIEVPGTAALNTGNHIAEGARVESVSCAAVRDCAAGGYYTDASRNRQAFVVDEANGVWGNAIEVPGTAALNTGDGNGGGARVSSVSCGAVGDCAAGGSYLDASDHIQAFLVDETNGVWGNAADVPGIASLNSTGADLNSISCTAGGDCAAGGRYFDGSGAHAFVADESNGVWGNAIKIPGVTALRSGSSALSLSCGAVGDCAAGGYYTGGSGLLQAFLADETNGVWGNAAEVPGTATLNSGGSAWVKRVSCGGVGHCAAGGSYRDGSSHQQAFVVAQEVPELVSAPVVNGTAALGSLLSTTQGEWTNGPTGYLYRWQRCDETGSNCTTIANETRSQYTLVSADVGHEIRSEVLASNGAGPAPSGYAPSTPTNVVSRKPTLITAPKLSGVAKVSNSLSVTTGSWNYSPTAYAYQWLRCTSTGTSCKAIPAATSSSYLLTAADAGRKLKAKIAASNAAGSTSALSNLSAKVKK